MKFYVLFCLFIACVLGATCDTKRPIVFFNGVMGSVLHGTANIAKDSTEIDSGCDHQYNDTRLWIRVGEFLSYNCFKQEFGMVFDTGKGAWRSIKGLEVYPPHWGGVYPLRTMDPAFFANTFTHYLKDFEEKMGKKGFKEWETLFSAPMDWRNYPTDDWVQKVKAHIENVTAVNGQPAVVIAHSMGGLNSYRFMSKMTSDWRKKYVHAYILVAPAFGGATKALDYLFSGMDESIPWGGKMLQDFCRTIPSIYYLLPNSKAFGKDNLMVETPSKNYTYGDLYDILRLMDIGNTDAKLAYNDKFLPDFSKFVPDITTRLLYSSKKDTVWGLRFKEDLSTKGLTGTWPEPKERIMGKGDGTVPLPALLYPVDAWKNAKDFKTVAMDDYEHTSIIKSDDFVNYILDYACVA